MFDDEKELSVIARQTVLCVGDLMLDEFVYGEVSRISPEAPAPVIAANRSEIVVGGAGNVARNIASLGAKCIFVGVIGADDAAQSVRTAWQDQSLIDARLVIDTKRPTTRKVRFVSEHFSTHLLRADWERAGPLDAAQEDDVIAAALSAMGHVGAVVLSDYAKGVLTSRVIRDIIAAARAADIPVVVDPKRHDYAIYRGCTIITPNRQELNVAMRTPDALSDTQIAASATRLLDVVESAAVLVTRSECGMTLVARDAEPVHVPAYPVKVRDVSGAGDTVVAVVATMLAARAGFVPAMRAANAAAAVAVSKRGTATVTVSELRTQILPAASLAAEQKIFFDWTMLEERLAEWRRQGLRIGFTNGCFDLLHPGHIKVLTEARAACDRLVVGLNSDASVQRLKGDSRPVQKEHARAEVLAALQAVDLVAVFAQDTPLELIKRVRPSVLVKGGDYNPDTVVGRDIVEAGGGEVVIVALAPNFSTTALVRRSHEPQK